MHVSIAKAMVADNEKKTKQQYIVDVNGWSASGRR